MSFRSFFSIATIAFFSALPCFGQFDCQFAPTYSPPTPMYADFCGEQVPLKNFDVRESVQREMNAIVYWHSSMLYTMQLANRYLPYIEKKLKEQGLPDDIKYLCIAESNLQNVVSPARASGFWQLMEGTAKEYGLEVNAEVDERYNLEKATLAACKYLRTAYQKFGNWTTAAASYNVGMAHITKQISEQKNSSYYDLHLNEETSRYVYRAVAFKEIMSNPEKYGFKLGNEDLFPPLRSKEVTIKGPIDWIDFATKNGTNYKILRIFNPWIRSTKLTRANKSYTVSLPDKSFRSSAYPLF